MDELHGATWLTATVALLVLLNNLTLLAHAYYSRRQRVRIEGKVDAVRDEAAIHRNGHISDDAVSPGPRR